MTYVLDTSAILRFLDNEPGATEVERLIKEAALGKVELLMSAANWAEVLFVLLKVHGQTVMQNVEDRLQSLPLRLIAVDPINARQAAEFRFKYKIPFADSFAGALALDTKSALVTADQDFRSVGNAIKVQFLPLKSKARTT
jgi:predicted nucleic acid-binding protein